MCFQTDGQENTSTTPDGWNVLNALIKEKTLAGWQFIFMGAGIDAYDQGAKMGISASSTVSYDHLQPQAAMESFIATASNTRSFGTGASLNAAYSMSQKAAAGDRFDPALKATPIVAHVKSQSLVDDLSLGKK